MKPSCTLFLHAQTCRKIHQLGERPFRAAAESEFADSTDRVSRKLLSIPGGVCRLHDCVGDLVLLTDCGVAIGLGETFGAYFVGTRGRYANRDVF